MLVETCAESDLVVLDHEYHGKILYCREVHALVAGGRFGGSIAHPGERKTRLPSIAKRQRHACHDRHTRTHVADRLYDPRREVADVQITTGARRVGGGEIPTEHVRQRHPHHVQGTGVADHRANDVPIGVEGAHGADRHCFFARAEPCLRDHTGAYPALQADVV